MTKPSPVAVLRAQCTGAASQPQRGFTLIELIIFIVVVAAGLAGILSVMNTVVKSSADPMIRKQSIAIAESVLEEVMLLSYNDPDGTNVGETGRANGTMWLITTDKAMLRWVFPLTCLLMWWGLMYRMTPASLVPLPARQGVLRSQSLIRQKSYR